MADLRFDEVSITYRSSSALRGDITAVSDISLDLPAGATLGIAGESGSGKTTLIMSALRLLPKSALLEGRVLLGGKDLSGLSFGQIRAVRWAEASIIFQGALHSLNPVREVGRQIVEALEHHAKEVWTTPQKRRQRMFDLLAEVDLDPARAAAFPHELSGGQKQRIMIAMALACEPEIIIADEPTTALDVIVQKQILQGLAGLVAVSEGQAHLWLVAAGVALALVAVLLRTAFGVLVLVVVAAGIAATIRWASPPVADAVVACVSWFLLVGGLRSGLALFGPHTGDDDAALLARSTGVPAPLWRSGFVTLSAGCVVAALALTGLLPPSLAGVLGA